MPNLYKLPVMNELNLEKDDFCVALDWLLRQEGRGAETNLAIDVGMSQAQISRIRHGHSNGTVATRNAIAEKLGRSIESMLTLGKRLKKGDRRAPAADRRKVSDNLNRNETQPVDVQNLIEKVPWSVNYLKMLNLASELPDLKMIESILDSWLNRTRAKIAESETGELPKDAQSQILSNDKISS